MMISGKRDKAKEGREGRERREVAAQNSSVLVGARVWEVGG
jgi:hypothetical protein